VFFIEFRSLIEYRVHLPKVVGLGFLLGILMLGFQNCGPGFQTETLPSDQNLDLSSSCSTKLTAERFLKEKLQGSLDCQDFDSIVCDQSVFSPDISDGKFSKTVCDDELGTGGCVRLNIINFNTLQAKNSIKDEDNSEMAEFAIGGSYNREEFRCTLVNAAGEVLITSEDVTLAQSLQRLIKDCHAKANNNDK
jgi:hypothetical protein